MEAELTLDIVGTFDAMAQIHRKLHKLQHQRITALSKCEVLPWTTRRCYDKLRLERVELLKRVRLNSTRIEHLYGLNALRQQRTLPTLGIWTYLGSEPVSPNTSARSAQPLP